MKKLVAIAVLTLMCGSAFAQDKGPAPQTGMEKPGKVDGAREDGSMKTTTGMNNERKGDIRDLSKDGSPSATKKGGTK